MSYATGESESPLHSMKDIWPHQSLTFFIRPSSTTTAAMGGKSSSRPAPPAPLLSKPWREITWNDKQGTLQNVNAIRPTTEAQVIRILLHGLVGAGKSSFTNSVNSVLQERMCSPATVANSSIDSCTKKHTTHKFNNGNQDTFYPFVINDTMGLSNNCSRSNRNNHVRDIEKALKGHVSEGYTFNPERRLSMDDPFVNLNPSANDKVHVLVFVIDANKFSQMNEKAVETLQDIREEAIRLDIPQVALLTKIDEFCPESQQDVKNVYKSKTLREKMKEVSTRVGIPVNCIFPVKNYSEELDLNSDTDALILSALKHILQLGNDHVNNHYA